MERTDFFEERSDYFVERSDHGTIWPQTIILIHSLLYIFLLLLIVVGPFLSYRVRNVSMVENESFRLPCGSISYKYRVSYSWSTRRPGMSLLPISSSFRPRILMEPNGDLLFSPVTANDVNSFMASGGRLKCSVTDLHRARNFVSPDIFLHVKSSGKRSTFITLFNDVGICKSKGHPGFIMSRGSNPRVTTSIGEF